jgi:predicted metal-binding membrane protein
MIGALDRAVRRDQLIVSAGLVVIAALSWVYLFRMSAMMNADAAEAAMHAAMGMTMPGHDLPWLTEFTGLWVMWAVMMAAMMLPSAAPMVLLVLGVYRRRDTRQASVSGGLFVAGYLLIWTFFSAAAAAVQIWLRQASLLSADMATTSRTVAAALLIAAGVYQWLPIKAACLTHCRSPLTFLSRHWREGYGGALSLGLRHGTFCVGCCFALMGLLFVAGVMNLLWVSAIAAFVLIEKLLSRGLALSRVGGALLVIWGACIMFLSE